MDQHRQQDQKRLKYFKFTPWYHWLWESAGIGALIVRIATEHSNSVPLLLCVQQVGVFCPEAMPYSLLGPLGSLLYYINYSHPTFLRIVFGGVSLIHAVEGAYAFILAK